MAQAFIIRPFGKKKDSSGTEIDFDRVHTELIEPALKAADLGGGTTGQIIDSGNIREDMFALILEADLVVADITVHNANVFYELGIRHALRKRRTVLIKGQPLADGTTFDLLTDRYLPYEIKDPAKSKDELAATIKSTMASDRQTDSPIFQMLPRLTEADPARVQVVPSDFREEVARATAADSAGWMRLLAKEVADRRFQSEGLRTVADAQWKLKDYEGARKNWETILKIYPSDVPANLALANIYERLYRHTKDPVLLEGSDQAIARVLGSPEITRAQRAEALTLRGRNQKTRWRGGLEGAENVDECREKGMNRALREAYEAYSEAFAEDLNHFYPGLTALQMGTILLELSNTDSWYDAFDDDEEAERYKRDLERRVAALRYVVPTSVEAALNRLPSTDENRIWAEISASDVLFLTESRPRRVVAAYQKAIPTSNLFAWDAAKGQLELFASLGVNPELARQVIEAIDPQFSGAREVTPAKAELPIHLVLFVGHRVDDGRAEPRFPAEREDQAKQLIRDALQELLDDEHQVEALASAAPGSDILFHEVCEELGVRSAICLPMPKEAFARTAFEHLDSWRSRYLDILGRHDVLELSHQEGLPRWLHGAKLDPWERGNQWVLEMALARGAKKVTVEALWDGKDVGDAPGGTAQMVQLARDAGSVHVQIIEAEKLLT
jgi:tetratricopeptide (TPR) repeat protein